MILYEIALSPFVQKVKIALREKGIDFENRLAFAPEHREEIERVCQRQEAPTLVDGETAIFDSTVILDYIEERWPKPSLMSRNPQRELRFVCLRRFVTHNSRRSISAFPN